MVNTTLVNTNKLSLNADKTSFSFFHKSSRKDGIPLTLPVLRMDKLVIERISSSIVLEVLLNEMLTWNHHFHFLQSKISKSMRLMYQAKFYLNQNCLQNIYYSLINSYLHYTKIPLASTEKITKWFSKNCLPKNTNCPYVYAIKIYVSI